MITLFWIICGAFLALYKYVTYDILNDRFVFFVPHNLSLGKFILINIIGPAIGGLLGGSLIVFRLNEKYRNRSYAYYLIVSILYFMCFIFVLNSAVLIVFYYKDQILNSNNIMQETLNLLLFDPYAIRNLISWMFIVFFYSPRLKDL